MAKKIRPLTANEVKVLVEPGRYGVGSVPGLMLLVKPTGARSWVLRVAIGSKRTDIGLGGMPEVTLAAATERAKAARELIRSGGNPVTQRRAVRDTIEWTFDRCASEYIAAHRTGWRNAKHADQWTNTIATYATPVIGSMHVRDVAVEHVLAIIEPHWLTKNETMVRLRNRIELILGWATIRKLRHGDNPAAWKGHLEHALPKPSKVNNRKHHAALPHADVPAFMRRLAEIDGMSALTLRWLILTACRSGEARGMTWGEVDMDTAIWTIPGSRMKSGREQRVPLSKQCLELLGTVPRFVPDGDDLVFTGRSGSALSDMSLLAVMRRMKVDAVPHGMRSSFADWSAEGAFDPELREMALAHTLGDKTREAYQRGDLLERRRGLMQAWGDFCASK